MLRHQNPAVTMVTFFYHFVKTIREYLFLYKNKELYSLVLISNLKNEDILVLNISDVFNGTFVVV